MKMKKIKSKFFGRTVISIDDNGVCWYDSG